MFKKLSLFVLFIQLTTYSQALPQIAVADFDGNAISQSDLDGLSNRLRIELVKSNQFAVLERSRMTEVLSEQGFQQTGCTNAECAVQIGQLLNVHAMIIGSIDKVSSVFSVNIRMVDVATGKITQVSNEDCINCDLSSVLLVTIPNVAKKLAKLDAPPISADSVQFAVVNASFQSAELTEWEKNDISRDDWASYKRSQLSLDDWKAIKKKRDISAKGLVVGYSLCAAGTALLIVKNSILRNSSGKFRMVRYRNTELAGSISLGLSIPIVVSSHFMYAINKKKGKF